MGAFFNPGAVSLQKSVDDEIFIDKSLILSVLNKKFNTRSGFLCVSRPRRFGKTVVGDLITAFYSRGANSRPIFERLKIARTPEWDRRLNKSNVIKITSQRPTLCETNHKNQAW